MRQPERAGALDINGASIYFEEFGRGRPVILLHGFALDRRMWDDQVEALAPHYRVVRDDLRGFGRSTAGPNPYRHALRLAPAQPGPRLAVHPARH